VVLNNFSEDDRKLKLTASMFQNMFPAINLKEVKLSDTRRVVLFNYDKETDRIDFRHYMIRVLPIGMSKRYGPAWEVGGLPPCSPRPGAKVQDGPGDHLGSVKRVIEAKIPNLGDYDDIADYILRCVPPGRLCGSPRSVSYATAGRLLRSPAAIHSEAQASESEVEDADNSVTLPQNYVGRSVGGPASCPRAVCTPQLTRTLCLPRAILRTALPTLPGATPRTSSAASA